MPCKRAHFLLSFASFLLLPVLVAAVEISYKVDFTGLEDKEVLQLIKETSQLTALKKHPPASLNALRYRAESDIPEIIKILHAYGYYEAHVEIYLEEEYKRTDVIVAITPGPVYKIGDYTIRLLAENGESSEICPQVDLENIGIQIGAPAIATDILNAELTLLLLLADSGYPLAEIEKREILADKESKNVYINLEIASGALATFGSVTILGETEVRTSYIRQKIAWEEGEIYDSRLVEKTQKILMDTGLFSSVLISHEEALQENGALAMKIDVAENKHRSVNVGASYQTSYGPGVTFGWENRNLNGLGRKLSFQGDILQKIHSGIATLLIPDFLRPNQDYIWQAQAMHEEIEHSYSMRSYNLTNRFESKIGERFRFSVGAKGERLYVTASVHNGNYVLVEAPIYLRWSTANGLLNPTHGLTIEYRTTPSANLTVIKKDYYLFQDLSLSHYLPFGSCDFFVLAQQISVGSILSRELNAIPVCKRFLGGSDEELRGYRYRTVSPLENGKPIGGRSAIYYTAEARFRVTDTMGIVPFFDTGVVHLETLPKVDGKWLKSVGIGYRYFSFLGPLRFDVAFPLNRREGLDPRFRIFVSIGQTF